jgi:hypothetical protein
VHDTGEQSDEMRLATYRRGLAVSQVEVGQTLATDVTAIDGQAARTSRTSSDKILGVTKAMNDIVAA